MSEQLYELLKQKDEHIDRLRAALESIVYDFAQLYSEDEQDKARERATEALRDRLYEKGLRIDGGLR